MKSLFLSRSGTCLGTLTSKTIRDRQCFWRLSDLSPVYRQHSAYQRHRQQREDGGDLNRVFTAQTHAGSEGLKKTKGTSQSLFEDSLGCQMRWAETQLMSLEQGLGSKEVKHLFGDQCGDSLVFMMNEGIQTRAVNAQGGEAAETTLPSLFRMLAIRYPEGKWTTFDRQMEPKITIIIIKN